MKTCASCGTTSETSGNRCPTCGAINFKEDAGSARNNTVNNPVKPNARTQPRAEANGLAELDLNDRRNDILLKIARHDIYRINAFRILEIPVTATPQEIFSHLHKLEILEKLGDTDQSPKGFLSLIPVPDAAARTEAQGRLGNPESRLIDELFWFWPLEAGSTAADDEAMNALKRSDFTGAVSIWAQNEETYSEAHISMHNMAVMFHVLALDMEYLQTDRLTPKQTEQKWNYWKQSFSRWQALLKQDSFWSRVNKRVLDMKYPQLTSGTVRRLRSGLPFILISINADLAIRAIDRGNQQEAVKQIAFIRNSDFAQEVKDIVLHRAVMPVVDRIKICGSNAANETKHNQENASTIIEELFTQVAPLLLTLDTFLPQSDPLRGASHDEIATQLRSLTIDLTNKQNKDWKTIHKLLAQALELAVGATVRQRLKDDVKDTKELIETEAEVAKITRDRNTCWFCKTNPPEDSANIKQKMYGDVNNDGTRITWKYADVTVPRCKKCKAAHSSNTNYGCAGLIVGTILAFFAGTNINVWVGIMIFAFFTAVGYLVPAALKPKGIKPESYQGQYPEIKERLAKGWRIGEKPPEAQ